MKKLLFLPALAAALMASGFADTVTLKSGEALEGKILNESAEAVTIELKLPGGITDERTVTREEIAKVDKLQADAIAYEGIKGIKPDAMTSFAPETYDGMMSLLKDFVDKFPSNPHAAEIQANLTALKSEQDRVAGGEVKFLGVWLNTEQAAARRVQIEAQQFYGSMKQLTAGGDYIGALNAFDQMEKKYAPTRSYPAAVELARQLAAALKVDAEKRKRDLQANDANFVKQLALTPEPTKSQIVGARKMEQVRADQALAAADKSGLKWKPMIPSSAKSLDQTAQTATNEVSRLASLPVAAMKSSMELTDQARSALASKDFDTAATRLQQARTAWPASEEVQYLTTQLTEAKRLAAASPTPDASPGASPGAAGEPAGAAKPKSTPRSTPMGARADSAGDKPFFKTIPGAIAIVVVVLGVLGGVNVAMRMKAKRAESE